MAKCVFIAGTDTDVGKTFTSSLILKALNEKCLLTCGFKPVASGSEWVQTDTDNTQSSIQRHLVNPDALTLQREASIQLPYQLVNPFCFEPAIAPHVAAKDIAADISVERLNLAFDRLLAAASTSGSADVLLTEGAGGWHVPLNNHERLSDWVIAQHQERQMGVILVVGLKLGAINHALLSAQAIAAAGVPLLGWVANRPAAEPMAREAETLDYLQGAIQAPLLADIGFAQNPQEARLSKAEQTALLTAIDCS